MVEVEERSCDLHGLRVYAHDDRFRGIASIVHMFLISRTGMEDVACVPRVLWMSSLRHLVNYRTGFDHAY